MPQRFLLHFGSGFTYKVCQSVGKKVNHAGSCVLFVSVSQASVPIHMSWKISSMRKIYQTKIYLLHHHLEPGINGVLQQERICWFRRYLRNQTQGSLPSTYDIPRVQSFRRIQEDH
jgi:hypothetical protein